MAFIQVCTSSEAYPLGQPQCLIKSWSCISTAFSRIQGYFWMAVKISRNYYLQGSESLFLAITTLTWSCLALSCRDYPAPERCQVSSRPCRDSSWGSRPCQHCLCPHHICNSALSAPCRLQPSRLQHYCICKQGDELDHGAPKTGNLVMFSEHVRSCCIADRGSSVNYGS